MKWRIVPVLLVPLICVAISSCDFLNALNRLATGEFVLSDVETDVNTPDWLDGETLISTTGHSTNLVELSAANGAIRRTHTIEDAEITRMNTISASPDGTHVVFQVRYKGPGYDPDSGNEEEADYSDILVFNLANGTTTKLTNASEWFSGASFLSNTEVVYFEFDDSVADEMSNRLIKYDLISGQTTVIFENTHAVVGDEIQGDVFYWGQAFADSREVLMGTTKYPSGEASFAIFDADTGAMLVDGTDVATFDWISRGDWIDENTLVVPSGTGADSKLSIIDLTTKTVVTEIPLVHDRIHHVNGLHISPDRTLVATSAVELDDQDNFVTNRLVVARIAEAVE